MIGALLYTRVPRYNELWDSIVENAVNSTFLHYRGYMDYHRDRFEDASVLFLTREGVLKGVLPACCSNDDPKRIVSHAGLTYGGLLVPNHATLSEVGTMLSLAARLWRNHEFTKLTYRPVPTIYHRIPSEGDLYWLFRAGAKLSSRGASTVIDIRAPEHTFLWKRKMPQARLEGLKVSTDFKHIDDYWDLETDVLTTRHGVRPVHSLKEIRKLQGRFPDDIRLVTVQNEAGETIAGTVLFCTETVVHTQYMAANDEGRHRCALDFAIQHVLRECEASDNVRYLDFGISTERQGHVLNEGLVHQKEGFGGRTVCYDSYDVSLAQLADVVED